MPGLQDEPFLAHDSGVVDQDRILVFGSPQKFERVSTAKIRFIDGTFKVTPSLFCQVYTVHRMYRGAVIMLACVLPAAYREGGNLQAVSFSADTARF